MPINPHPWLLRHSQLRKSLLIKALKTKNSRGFDEISTNYQKSVPLTYVRTSLTCICNKSILSGIFPDYMKCSITKPD
jgi:hypothetical protein